MLFLSSFEFSDQLADKISRRYDYRPQFYDVNNNFYYEKFLRFLLLEAESSMERINLPAGLSIKTRNHEFNPDRCSECQRYREQEVEEQRAKGTSSIYCPQTHCLDHLPAICQTKLGICLVLKFQSATMTTPRNVVVDLITGLPVNENSTLGIYEKVLTNLMKEKPPGFQKVLDSHFSRDRAIPDDMDDMLRREFGEQSVNFLGIKLLSWGPGPNYQVRPGQTVKVNQFADKKTKEAYIVLKGLVKMLDINVSGYLLKKSLLGTSTYRVDGLPRYLIVRNAMISPELWAEFSKYVKIMELSEDTIPLTAEGQKRARRLPNRP